MNEWLFRRRDPAAVVITLACMGLLLTAHGLQPMRPAQPPAPIETEVSLIEELAPLPSAAPAPNRPETAAMAKPTAATPAVPSPVAPLQTPSPQATPSTTAPPAAPQSTAHAGPATDAPTAPPAAPVATGPAVAESPRPAAQTAVPSPAVSPSARGAEDGYRADLRALLNSIKRYPNSREARQLRPQGTVKLWIDIERNGQLLGVGVETSSGTLLLDNEALRTVRSGRFPAFPAEAFGNQPHHRFVVPIEYTVENG